MEDVIKTITEGLYIIFTEGWKYDISRGFWIFDIIIYSLFVFGFIFNRIQDIYYEFKYGKRQ